jgi:predicted phosphohydrolase
MRLQIASDLHLEFPENRYYMKLNPLEIAGDILLLAGDIVPLRSIDKHRDFFNFLSDHYKHTYWVPGNHEYYDFDIANRAGTFQESVRSNVTLLNNCTVELEKIRLHFTSLWSNISKSNAWNIEGSLMDFHLIKFEGQRLSVEQYNRMHAESLAFLQAALHPDPGINGEGKKNVIVTHHVPTFQHYPPKYLGNFLNEAFATDLDDFIKFFGADYWIYGHHHAATDDFLIGNTKLVTNQLGYIHHGEHGAFNTGRVLILDE